MTATEYPEIIKEMIAKSNSDELTMLRYGTFEDALKEVDKSMDFFSVYVKMEDLDREFSRDERFVTISKRQAGSYIEQRISYYWFDRNEEHFRLIDERMASLKSSPEYSHIKEWELRDEVALKDRVLEELNKEIQPKIIEMMKGEYKQMYEDEWEEHWKEVDLFTDQVEYRYRRKNDMPIPFRHWDDRNFWQQFYFARDKEGNFYYQRGGSGSSDQRYCHGIYGHLFAIINDEKPVPTYFFIYDSQNRFVFKRQENSLWLDFLDITTNCALGGKESQDILKNIKSVRKAEWS